VWDPPFFVPNVTHHPGDIVADPNLQIRNGLFLEYRVEASTGPGRTRAATERLTFREQPDGRFQVQLEAEEVPVGLYAAAYGEPIVVDARLAAGNGMALQFRGLCPFLLTSSQRAPDAEVAWLWDGAGVEPIPDEPQEQLIMRAVVRGPVQWRKWSTWILQRTDTPSSAPSPVAYYEQVTGLLVGVEFGSDIPGVGRFVFCDAELQLANADGV
jgi:hypothetical protein